MDKHEQNRSLAAGSDVLMRREMSDKKQVSRSFPPFVAGLGRCLQEREEVTQLTDVLENTERCLQGRLPMEDFQQDVTDLSRVTGGK